MSAFSENRGTLIFFNRNAYVFIQIGVFIGLDILEKGSLLTSENAGMSSLISLCAEIQTPAKDFCNVFTF